MNSFCVVKPALVKLLLPVINNSLIQYGKENPYVGFVVILGNEKNINKFYYNPGIGDAGISAGSPSLKQAIRRIGDSRVLNESEVNITGNMYELTIKGGEIKRTFNLTEGQNFYIVVEQDIAGERYIANG